MSASINTAPRPVYGIQLSAPVAAGVTATVIGVGLGIVGKSNIRAAAPFAVSFAALGGAATYFGNSVAHSHRDDAPLARLALSAAPGAAIGLGAATLFASRNAAFGGAMLGKQGFLLPAMGLLVGGMAGILGGMFDGRPSSNQV